MDIQVALAVIGTGAGVISAYYAFVQHQKSRNPKATNNTAASNTTDTAPQVTKSWSAAVDKALENFRKGRRNCHVEIAQQKNFDKSFERFSTSELILHVKYLEAGGEDDLGTTHRFEMKINKDGDILEMETKGKRKSDSEKFR